MFLLSGKREKLKIFWVYILFLFSCFSLNAQINFKGVVFNENNTPINRARIYLKSGSTTKYTFTNSKGEFQIKLDSLQENSVVLIASSTQYKNDSISISISKNKFTYIENFNLKKALKPANIHSASSKVLDEVVVEGKRKPIEIKKDTVVYNTENYIDGSEKNVEDLLKKLPGIEVKENGSIEFKGKAVVAVMLDGGDLFNSNYMTGTRSINPNIIDQVQAIERWSDNPILKSLNAEDKVALNLKLKKDKVSFSSSIRAESDFYKKYNLGGYALMVNSLIKTFATTNYNNVGENKSPLNLSTNTLSFEDYKNNEYQAPFLIKSNSIDTQFGEEKANRNQQWFNSSNSLIKLSDKANVKIIGSMVKDKILIDNSSENFYNLNDESIYTKDENNIVKKPLYFTGDVELKWYKSGKEYIEIRSSISSLNEKTDNNLISNYSNGYQTKKDIKNLFSKNEGVYTLKLKEKKALQIRALYTYNKKPQNLLIHPSLPIYATNDSINYNFQNISSTKEHIGIDFILYQVFSEDHKLNSSLGFSHENYSLASDLKINDTEYSEDFNNKIKYRTNDLYLNFDYAFKNKKWNISFNQKNQLLYQTLDEISQIRKNIFLNSTKLSIFRTLFFRTSAFISGNITTSPIDEQYLFRNKILISNRNIISNNYSLGFESLESYQFGFSYNNAFLSQFKGTISAGYTKNKNTITSQYLIDSNLDFTQYYRSNKPMETYNISTNFEKFFPFLSSRFNLKSSYLTSEYFNTINNYDITKVKTQSFYSELIHQIALEIPLSIRNYFNYIYTESKSKISEKSTNHSFSMKNQLSYSFKKNSLVLSLINEYYKPDLSQTNDILFLNFSVNYSPKKSRFKYFLTLNNILNQEFNYSKYIQDYAVTYNKIELLHRTFLIGCNIDF